MWIKSLKFALMVLFFFTIGELQWSKNEPVVQPDVMAPVPTGKDYIIGHSELRLLPDGRRVRIMTGSEVDELPVSDWTMQQQPQVRTADGKWVDNYPLIPDGSDDHTRMCDR